jgi:hypothetical protein
MHSAPYFQFEYAHERLAASDELLLVLGPGVPNKWVHSCSCITLSPCLQVYQWHEGPGDASA